MLERDLDLPSAFYEVWPQLQSVVTTSHSDENTMQMPVEVEQKEVAKVNDLDTLKDKINAITTKEELQDVAALFNLNITKKEMTRALKQDDMLDLIVNQLHDRVVTRQDEMSTADLLEIAKTVKSNIEKTQTYIDRVEEAPTIEYNDNKQVTVNINTLSRDSSENVIDALQELFKSGSIQEVVDAVNTIDVTNTEVDDD